MAVINPSINFNGNTEEAFTFYQSAFGGTFSKVIRFKDMPSDPAHPIPESEANKIMHIALPIGPNVLIGNDVPSFMGQTNEHENRSKIAISAESKAEAEKLYKELSQGGDVEVALDDNFAMLRDKYGIEWIIEFDPNHTK